jgi:hypothetical protein
MGHAFFSVDRPAYRVVAANDGWELVAAIEAALESAPAELKV